MANYHYLVALLTLARVRFIFIEKRNRYALFVSILLCSPEYEKYMKFLDVYDLTTQKIFLRGACRRS